MSLSTLTPDRSITLPPEVVDRLGLKPGDRLSVDITPDGGIVLKPAPETQTVPPSCTPKADPVRAPLAGAIARKNLETPMQFIKGVGPKLSELLTKRGVATVEDALYLLPHRYEDRRDLRPIADLRPGNTEVFTGEVVSSGATVTKGGRRLFEAVIRDAGASVTVKWFNANPTFMKRTWRPGRRGVFTGEVTRYGLLTEVHHPEAEWLAEGQDVRTLLAADPVNFGRLVPVYPLTEGLSQKVMRKVMKEVVETYLPYVEQRIPAAVTAGLHLPELRESVAALHLPPLNADLAALNSGSTGHHRALAFDEFFFWELGLALKRQGIALEEGISFTVEHRYTKQLARLLPFELTGAQRRVLTEIKNDMMAPHPMHRLVQGDVGSGKTLVALMAALLAVENGYQVAIMAPTEILAEQHWHTMHRWCSELGLEAVLITAAMKGRARTAALARIADGSAAIVIGTHAVIQERVEFRNLGLGIIDEQHRFGVLQRAVLKQKGPKRVTDGEGAAVSPDILVMTATPIPRTLAMTLFGDLSLSVIDELPPGRSPIETRVFGERQREQVYRMIRRELEQGRQAYVIYPLVEESEKSDLKAATQMAAHLAGDVFADYRVGLLHGRLSPDDKEGVMASFKARELDILVATTVIEVGIDVPNATVMVVEHAERFGLSQLHQLRGRVGRGAAKSRCLLITGGGLSQEGERRLKVMEETGDGFRIAEADLEIRGPGDFLGTRQSGMPDFRVANILRDGRLLEQARQAAFRVIEADPDLSSPANAGLRQELVRRWGSRLELGSIG